MNLLRLQVVIGSIFLLLMAESEDGCHSMYCLRFHEPFIYTFYKLGPSNISVAPRNGILLPQLDSRDSRDSRTFTLYDM